MSILVHCPDLPGRLNAIAIVITSPEFWRHKNAGSKDSAPAGCKVSHTTFSRSKIGHLAQHCTLFPMFNWSRMHPCSKVLALYTTLLQDPHSWLFLRIKQAKNDMILEMSLLVDQLSTEAGEAMQNPNDFIHCLQDVSCLQNVVARVTWLRVSRGQPWFL